MQHFIGTYECKADTKGRIMLPAALKKQLSSYLNKSFVIKRAVFNNCLELYPLDQWEGLMEKVHCMSSSSMIHIHYNHDPVQAQLRTQRVWERYIITFRTEVVGENYPSTKGRVRAALPR